jgi:hypothetical protein
MSVDLVTRLTNAAEGIANERQSLERRPETVKGRTIELAPTSVGLCTRPRCSLSGGAPSGSAEGRVAAGGRR